jgi:hypothetical protein
MTMQHSAVRDTGFAWQQFDELVIKFSGKLEFDVKFYQHAS